MSNDIRDIIERLAILEGRITPVDVKHGLNADQKAVKQLPALFKPKDISPTLSKAPYQKHPMDGWLVGEEETDEPLVELDYAHDFRGWQRDAQAAGLEIKRQPQDETGNMTNSFIAVKPGNEDSSGGVKVGHFDGQKGGGILAASPEEYQSTISGGFGQHMDDAYEKDVNRLYTGQDVVKKIAELAGCKVNEVAPEEQGRSTGGSVEAGTIPHDDINLDADDIPWHASGTLPGEQSMDEMDEEADKEVIEESKVDEEKLLDKVKKSLTDYLQSVEEKLEKKIDRDLGDKPADRDIGKKSTDKELVAKELDEDPTEEDPVIQAPTAPLQDPTYAESACVKSMVLENGAMFEIHGNEHTGFEIRHGNRTMKSKFKNIDEAAMAIEMFRARQKKNDESQDYIEEA
jgi:hypothetical protein